MQVLDFEHPVERYRYARDRLSRNPIVTVFSMVTKGALGGGTLKVAMSVGMVPAAWS